MRRANVLGARFGALVVVAAVESRAKNSEWLCDCDCGRRVSMRLPNLKRAASCGCLRNRQTSERNTTHGSTRTKEYRAWAGAKNRCGNQAYPGWEYYGGRGIRICARWAGSFADFMTDMGRCPAGCSIDRIDCDGDYEPENCRWATAEVQSRNRRCVRRVVASGEALTVPEWAARLGVSPGVIHARVRVLGWSYEQAVTSPKNAKGWKHDAND